MALACPALVTVKAVRLSVTVVLLVTALYATPPPCLGLSVQPVGEISAFGSVVHLPLVVVVVLMKLP